MGTRRKTEVGKRLTESLRIEAEISIGQKEKRTQITRYKYNAVLETPKWTNTTCKFRIQTQIPFLMQQRNFSLGSLYAFEMLI
jgi:hypothetical protein